MMEPVIIYDTDMDTDCDDVGALSILLNYALAKKARLLGVIADAPTENAAPCCEAICRFYGVDCLIGAVQADRYRNDPRFESYRIHRSRLPQTCYYNETLAHNPLFFPKTADAAPFTSKTDKDYLPAPQAYRQMLSHAEDGSVTIVCVGLMTGLTEFLESGPDDISPLSGVELCRQKVKQVVSMSTVEYPRYDKPNFNYMMDAVGANKALALCPVPILISPDGTDVITGSAFSQTLPENHPLRIAYTQFVSSLFGRAEAGRSSWDLIAALYALEPDSPMFRLTEHGTAHYETNGVAWWDETHNRHDGLISITVPPEEMAAHLDRLMTEGLPA